MDDEKIKISKEEIEELYKRIIFFTNMTGYIREELKDIEEKLYRYLDRQDKINS